jgi:hypothetical protein
VEASVRVTNNIYNIHKDMCTNADQYLSDTQSYNEEAMYKLSKDNVYQVHIEDLIGKTKVAVKIGTKIKSVDTGVL